MARLLSALDAVGAYAVEDPTQDGMVIVRAGGSGVSIGAGSHPRRAAEDLVRRDLAQRAPTASGRIAYCLSDAGRAHARRRSAPAGRESAYLAQHCEVVDATVDLDGAPARVRMNAAESPLTG